MTIDGSKMFNALETRSVFSEPMAAGPQTHADMVSELLRVHNSQLLAHVRREMRIAELAGDLPRGIVDPRDVVDEVARICLHIQTASPRS